MNKLSKFARSPQGKKLQNKAMDMAKDPKTKAKIAEVKGKLDGKDDTKPAPTTQPGAADAPKADAGAESRPAPTPPTPPAPPAS